MTDDERPAVAGDVIDLELLITMANQIGDFFAPYPPERAREGLRNHLRINWDPRMRNALLAHIDAGGDGLDLRVIVNNHHPVLIQFAHHLHQVQVLPGLL